MSNIFLTLDVEILLFTQILLTIMLSIAVFYALQIYFYFQPNIHSALQYSIEKKTYLLTLIISICFLIEIFLLPFFINTLDNLTSIVPGAMCPTGILMANEFGLYLLVLKIIILFLASFWLVLNQEDQKRYNYPFLKKKIIFFLFIYLFILLESYLLIHFFSLIETSNPVSCCSSIYTQTNNTNPLPFNLSKVGLVLSFYGTFILLLISLYLKKRIILGLVSLLFLYLSYYSIVYFFAIYIYELPTHLCPFCIMQSDYYYIGYLIYALLFSATFYALSSAVFDFYPKYKLAIYYYIVFIFLISTPFILYYFKNGTLL